MSYKHGIYGSELATSLLPMTSVSAGLPVIFGTAPVHLATDAAAVNTPVLCHTYGEAVAAFGYSADWKNYTLCEAMKVQYALFGMAPAVFVNVLDVSTHKTAVIDKESTLTDGTTVLDVSETAVLSTLKVKKASAGQALQLNTDYTAAYDDAGRLTITAISGGALNEATKIYCDYDKADASKVTAADIVGGVDTVTGKNEGLELIAEIYPRFGLIPGTIIAPGWSQDVTVAAVMRAKATSINGCFKAIALADIPTDAVTKYSEAEAWKSSNNYVDPYLAICWPLLSLGGVKYHMSTQLAALMCQVDSEHDDVPYWSPSNHKFQADSTVIADGKEVYLDTASAAYLNGQGIVTAINFVGGWKAWGNRTSAYPSNTDVKDTFIPVRRMFNWVNNTLITTFWSKIDNPTNKRLVQTIVDSANIWFNGLAAAGCILGGRVEFRKDENSTTDLMDGKMHFHVYLTPPSPARDIEFIQEYDPDYVSTLFE